MEQQASIQRAEEINQTRIQVFVTKVRGSRGTRGRVDYVGFTRMFSPPLMNLTNE